MAGEVRTILDSFAGRNLRRLCRERDLAESGTLHDMRNRLSRSVHGQVSAALDRPVRAGLAMTGEVSLHGLVGQVGGVARKIVAAACHQRKMVIIPAQNALDLRDVPDEVLSKIEVVTVERIEEVLQYALGGSALLFGGDTAEVDRHRLARG